MWLEERYTTAEAMRDDTALARLSAIVQALVDHSQAKLPVAENGWEIVHRDPFALDGSVHGRA